MRAEQLAPFVPDTDIIEPPPGAPRKPDYGAPCNGCGVCCIRSVCGTGRMILKLDERPGMPCPALLWIWQDRRYVCGLMYDPARFAPTRVRMHGATKLKEAAKWLIGSGIGCLNVFKGDLPAGPEIPQRSLRYQELMDAYRLWGIAKIAKRRKAIAQERGVGELTLRWSEYGDDAESTNGRRP